MGAIREKRTVVEKVVIDSTNKGQPDIKIKSKGLSRGEKRLIYDTVKRVIKRIRYERKKSDGKELSYLINLK